MTPLLTEQVLAKAFPTLSKATRAMVLNSIKPAIERYDISSSRRLAAFLGQCAHESAMFTAKIENLNYSAKGLTATWPTRFPPALAVRYARNPVAIGNRAYSNRMGNGPEASGDGFKHRGRAWIQLTGKDNYAAFAGSMAMTIDQAIEYLETDEGAWMASAWFWSRNNLNRLADGWEITKLGGRINGVTPPIGNKDRLALCNAALKAFG